MGNSRTAIAFAFSSLAVLATSASCLDPTQITVDMSTDVKCSDAKGTAIAGGVPGTLDVATPTTMTGDCTNGHIGTLVSTPSGSKDTDAAFLVVLGVDRPVSECTPANKFDGCIVQRRLIHYVKHTPLNLPITMWLVCKDVKCDSQSTCARSGKCVSARIEDPEDCARAGCFPRGDEPPAPGEDGGPIGEAGLGEAGLGDADASEGGPIDAGKDSSINDAAIDGPPTALPGQLQGQLYCPPVPSSCPPQDLCCFTSLTGQGSCSNTGNCPSDDAAMKCTVAEKDCTTGGEFCCGVIAAGTVVVPGLPSVNAASFGTPSANGAKQFQVGSGEQLTSTSCQPMCPLGPWICFTPADCPPTTTCLQDTNVFPYINGPFKTCQ